MFPGSIFRSEKKFVFFSSFCAWKNAFIFSSDKIFPGIFDKWNFPIFWPLSQSKFFGYFHSQKFLAVKIPVKNFSGPKIEIFSPRGRKKCIFEKHIFRPLACLRSEKTRFCWFLGRFWPLFWILTLFAQMTLTRFCPHFVRLGETFLKNHFLALSVHGYRVMAEHVFRECKSTWGNVSEISCDALSAGL